MAITYLVTGASGHLGFNIVSQLSRNGCKVRALVQQDDKAVPSLEKLCELYYGTVTDKASMEEFFDCSSQDDIYVIHCAETMTLMNRFDQKIWDTNVGGTQNILDMCRLFHVRRLVYVSSVLAIPQLPEPEVMNEDIEFSTEQVSGLYAKTKAAATQLVLQAAPEDLNVSVVLPSLLIGPGDYEYGPVSAMIQTALQWRLQAAPEGRFDFADVRDVASGTIKCLEKGQNGACYVLSNQFFSVKYILDMVNETTGIKPVSLTMPGWIMKLSSPVVGAVQRSLRRRPLYNSYSVDVLHSNPRYSHQKASDELGYTTRDIRETVADTVSFFQSVISGM